MIDQDLPHSARRHTKEVVLTQDSRFQAMQFQEQLADEGGGLQCVSGALAPEQGGGDDSKPVERQLVDSVPGEAISLLGFLEQACECFGHNPRSLWFA